MKTHYRHIIAILATCIMQTDSFATCPDFPLIAWEAHSNDDTIPTQYNNIAAMHFNTAVEYFVEGGRTVNNCVYYNKSHRDTLFNFLDDANSNGISLILGISGMTVPYPPWVNGSGPMGYSGASPFYSLEAEGLWETGNCGTTQDDYYNYKGGEFWPFEGNCTTYVNPGDGRLMIVENLDNPK